MLFCSCFFLFASSCLSKNSMNPFLVKGEMFYVLVLSLLCTSNLGLKVHFCISSLSI